MSDHHYRGWTITHDPTRPPSHAWQYVSDEYDGPEDRRIGTGPSLAACMAAIDEIEGEAK